MIIPDDLYDELRAVIGEEFVVGTVPKRVFLKQFNRDIGLMSARGYSIKTGDQIIRRVYRATDGEHPDTVRIHSRNEAFLRGQSQEVEIDTISWVKEKPDEDVQGV